MKLKPLLKGLLLIAALASLGFAIKASGIADFFDKSWIDSDIRGQGLLGELIFLAVGALLTAVGMPRQVVAFLAGYAFGLTAGVIISVVATLGGCIIGFYFARLSGRDFVTRKFPRRVKRINAFLSENPFAMTLLIRFLPAGSNLVTNLAAGVSSVPALSFFIGSGIGYIPQMVVFALVGSGVTLDPTLRIGLGIILFLISGALGVYLYRKYRHGKSLDPEIDHEPGADQPT